MSAHKEKTLVLLDVHAILHRAYHALPDFQASTGEPTGALYGLATMLLKLVKDISPDYIVACYDLPQPTKRHEVYDAYKAGRKEIDQALVDQIESSHEFFKVFGIPEYSSPGFEADDMLGTIVEQTKGDKNIRVVIASGDMDTLQLVSGEKVRVYTLKKGIKDTIIYDEKAVMERFGFGPELLPDYKGLRGDPSDNIIGISGIGEKTAEELIGNFGSIEDIYKTLKKDESLLEKKGIKKRIIGLLKDGENDALFSKMLATIRRDAPIHFTLPEKTFSEGVNIGKVDELFTRLEFRQLGGKVREMLSIAPEEKKLEEVDPQLLYDTSLMLWVLDSNKTNPTLEDILSFTHTQTLASARAYLEGRIKGDDLTFILDEVERPLVVVTDKMKKVGIAVDKKKFSDLSKTYHKEVGVLEKKIWELAGVEFNISSPKQLGEVLFQSMGLRPEDGKQKKTASGSLSTKESELQKINHPIIDLIFEYRELTKLLGTYIDTIPDMVAEDGRLHAEFLQMGAVTGRMASQNPNLQNIPNRTEQGREIRKAFVAGKGKKLVAFDYSQIELRIAAFLSGDKKMIQIFKEGLDVHAAVASEVFAVPVGEVTKEMRRRAKIINFGVMYGMGVSALQKNLGTDRKSAQEFYDAYFNQFSGLAEYLENVKRETAQKGFTETFFGRRRYFPDIHSKLPFMRAMAERMAINAPIQGTEADVVKLAMIKINNMIEEKKLDEQVALLLQVHDELVYEIDTTLVEEIAPKIRAIMESIIPPEKASGVVCEANISVGENWGEMEELQ